MSLVIGFTNKMYTLWQKTFVETTRGGYDKYTYLRNISMNFEEAQKKYPDAEIDLTLRGHKEVIRVVFERPKYADDEFSFGKYAGEKITDSTDYKYLEWYYRQLEEDSARKEIIKSILEPRGYGFVGERCIMDPETYQCYLEEQAIEEAAKKMVESGNIEFVPEYNIDYEGEINVDGILYRFEHFQEFFYSGYEYYLPVLNGKSKRIKNKKVIVTEFEILDDDTVLIKNFKVEKVA